MHSYLYETNQFSVDIASTTELRNQMVGNENLSSRFKEVLRMRYANGFAPMTLLVGKIDRSPSSALKLISNVYGMEFVHLNQKQRLESAQNFGEVR